MIRSIWEDKDDVRSGELKQKKVGDRNHPLDQGSERGALVLRQGVVVNSEKTRQDTSRKDNSVLKRSVEK
jgi:hypothetical protein